jgi:NAD+ synthase (glutamine-hydrolysing)
MVVVDLDVESVFAGGFAIPDGDSRTWSSPACGGIPIGTPDTNRAPSELHEVELLEDVAEIYQALVLGTRDYVRKNGFQKVVLGLSGGIDSALTACVAVDALGSANVAGVLMPSEFSSRGSIEDAEQLGRNLGIELFTIPIGDVFDACKRSLQPVFKATQSGAPRNLQARIRGTLMALSNKFGWLVLSTGNKSEISTGYCTLYGDMAGGFAILKDVMKTTVYKLAEHVNCSGKERIPRSTIEKPPSAELRPNQLDTDSLPPYDVLDPILKAYVEEDRSLADMVEMGSIRNYQRIVRLVDANEYKRVRRLGRQDHAEGRA